ncbi:MAG: metallophosphoesterase [Polyangiaceae bacterium]|nr:metallophosphoesterase [Polyangiaceae bacterium]MCW5789388.1 metallophosphoesterase [Polyangiaceae bacterium]
MMRAAVFTDLHLGPDARFEGRLRKLSAHARPFLGAFVARLRGLSPDAPEAPSSASLTEAPHLLDEGPDASRTTGEAPSITLTSAARPQRSQRVVPPGPTADVVINLGDVLEDESALLDAERYQELTAALALLPCPKLHVAGNHDRIHLSDQALLALWAENQLTPSALHYSRDIAGVHFAVLATEETRDVDVRLPKQQLEWLEADLAATELATIVCVHHPLSDCQLEGNRWFAAAPHLCRVVERKQVRQVIEASGKVALVLNGHAHWNHFDLIHGVPYVTLQSPIENLDEDAPGRPACTFGWVELDAQRVLVRVFGAQPATYQLHLSPELGSRVAAAT